MDMKKQDGRRTRHEPRRQELLDAAVEYVFAHGLSTLSIRPLAEALGISHRTLLYHFGSKEDLIIEVLKEVRERERLFFAFLSHDQEPKSLAAFLTSIWQHCATPEYERYFRLFFEIYGLALQDPALYRGFLQGVVADWLPIFEHVLACEGYPPESALATATLLLSIARGLQLDALTTHDYARIEAAIEILLRALSTLLPGKSQPTIADPA
jgi:AcrR family transcriptional regulator